MQKKNYTSGSLFSKVQHYYLNYQGLLSLCEWLQYIIYAYFVYVYVLCWARARVCVYNIYERVCLIASKCICFVCCTNVCYTAVGLNVMKGKIDTRFALWENR